MHRLQIFTDIEKNPRILQVKDFRNQTSMLELSHN